MLNFNWIITLFEKEYRQREMLLYDYDDNHYYSAKNHKYFLLYYYENSIDMMIIFISLQIKLHYLDFIFLL